MQLYMTGRKKASATANIPAIQILPHPKKYLRYQISQPCRYYRILKSICDSKYPSHADTTTPQKYQATMQSGELESGMPDEAEQESIVAWYFVWRTDHLLPLRRSLPEQAPHSLPKHSHITAFPHPSLVQIKKQ